MAFQRGPNIVTGGLVLALDAGNTKSYPGSGTTWTDLSRNGNNGTLTNGPTFNSANNGSIVFDGVDDNITFASSSNYSYGTSDFSVDYWFNLSSLTATQQAMLDAYSTPNNTTSGGTFGFVLTNTQITTYANNGRVFTSSSISLPTNTWINLTFVRSSGVLYVYRNASLIDSTPCTWDFRFTGNASKPFLYIGINPGANSFYFNGRIGSVKIYKGTGLNSAQVLQNYNALKSRYNPE